MGIRNLHILHEPPKMTHAARKAQDYIEARRTVEHHAGQHPDGKKRRDCPLCQAGK